MTKTLAYVAAAVLLLWPAASLAQDRALIGELEGAEVLTDVVPASFNEAPQLAELVAAGKLPPVAERVGSEPLVLRPVDEIGKYGGTWRRAFLGPNDWVNGTRGWLHDRLLFWDYTETEIVPNIAKGYEMSEDGRTLDLFLRNGARWSDGEPFTADDFMFWFNDIAANKEINPNGIDALRVSGEPVTMEKVDDYTVRFVSVNPYYTLPIKLASVSTLGGFARFGQYGQGGYAPEHYLKQFLPKYAGEDAVKKMATDAGFDNWVTFFLEKANGFRNPDLPAMTAWKLVQPITGDVWSYERNPYSIWVDEAGNQLPYIDEVVLTKAENLEVVALRAISGEFGEQARHIDLTKLPVLLENQEAGNYTVHLDTSNMGGEAYLCVNASYAIDPEKGKLFANPDFRRAISLGIDRDAINEVLFLGLGTPGSIAPREGTVFSPGPDSEYRAMWSTYEPDKANAMLDAIGTISERDSEGYRLLPGGKRLSVELMTYVAFMSYTALGEMIAEDFKDLGIEVKVVEYERTASQTRRRANESEMTIDTAWGSENIFGHPSEIWPISSYSCMGPEYGKWVASKGAEGIEPLPEMARVEELYQSASSVPPEERAELVREIWRIILDQQWAIGTVGLSPAIQGVRVVDNDIGNMPERQVNSAIIDNPAGARPEQWYFKS
jgi:peptide/nickel transport system substrate-binding protein